MPSGLIRANAVCHSSFTVAHLSEESVRLWISIPPPWVVDADDSLWCYWKNCIRGSANAACRSSFTAAHSSGEVRYHLLFQSLLRGLSIRMTAVVAIGKIGLTVSSP
jgi:hypothetical protein